MEPFRVLKGIVATLDRANVDTDQIIPKQFLKSIARTGFGENLFFDWRYLPDGKPDPDFILNHPRFKGASILVARNNFGCGSSREHAVWAIQQDGYKVVVAPSVGEGSAKIPGFADIFKNNCSKNALLAIELSDAEVEKIFQLVEKNNGLQATVNLEAQTLTVHGPKEEVFHFQIDAGIKHRMLNGLDDIGLTLQQDAAISTFEAKHQTYISSSK